MRRWPRGAAPCNPAVQSPELAKQIQYPFQAGLLFVSACLLLTLFVYIRNRIQSFLTHVIFLRSNITEALAELQQLARAAHSESEYLRHAAELIAQFLRASRFDVTEEQPVVNGTLTAPVAVLDSANWTVPPGCRQFCRCVFPKEMGVIYCWDHATADDDISARILASWSGSGPR